MKSVATLIGLSLIASAARAGDALPMPKPNKFTQHDLRRVQLASNRRTLVEAYEAVGRHDPKWDAAAEAFLERLAFRFTNGQFRYYYARDDDPDTSTKTMLDLGNAALQAGCTDPLVRYAQALILKDSGDRPGYIAAMIGVMPDLLASGYPANRKYNALAHRIDDIPWRDSAEQSAAQAQRLREWAQDLADPVKDPLERRLKIDTIVAAFETITAADRAAIIAGVDGAPAADAWVKHMLHGLDEVKLAWEARGGGWAKDVNANGWQGFADHLAKARDELVAAYTLEPNYPEAAAAMITVAMGGDQLNENTREWFDRAVTAQIDYLPAWKSYEWSIYPRWGGSHQAMYALGCEAMRSRRFDTNVPEFLLTVLQDIAHDGDGDYGFHRLPAVWPNVEAVFDGYFKQPFPKMETAWWKTREAGFAYRCGQYGEAVKILDALKGDAKPEAMESFDVAVQDVELESRALASDAAPELRAAAASEQARDFTSATNIYLSVVRSRKPDHPAYAFARLHADLCGVSGPLAEGSAADVPLAHDYDLLGWRGDMAKWKIDAAGLSFTSKGVEDATMKHLVAVPPNLRVTVEWSYSSSKPTMRPSLAVMFQNIGKKNGDALAVAAYPTNRSITVCSRKWQMTGGNVDGVEMPPDAWQTLSFEHRGKSLSVSLNGKPLIENVTNDWLAFGTPMLGLCVTTPPGGGTVRVRKLTLQALENQ